MIYLTHSHHKHLALELKHLDRVLNEFLPNLLCDLFRIVYPKDFVTVVVDLDIYLFFFN